jgi:DNA-binding NtrC family response regulator
MARIVSVSYDETLLLTRELLLKGAGHEVTSCLGYVDALNGANSACDVAIIGHSIPKQDKLDMIAAFRRNQPKAVIVALTRGGEPRLNEVDVYVTPGDPEELIGTIRRIVKQDSRRAARAGKEAGMKKDD